MIANRIEKFIIKPSQLISGEAQVLGDKSISHRAIIFASIADGKSQIKNCLMGEDNLATLDAFNQMGVQSKITNENILEIEGVGLHGLKASSEVMNLGNSGTAIRLLTGLLSGQKFQSTLTGDDSILNRPMARVSQPLIQMGAKINLSNQNYPPINIFPSQLIGSEIEMKVASAQVKSAILLAGLYAKGQTTIHFSESTRNHTELMMASFGIDLEVNQNSISINQQTQSFQAKDIEIVGDISSASFLIAAGILSKKQEQKLIIKNVGVNPTRSSGIEIMTMMGAKINLVNQSIQSNEPMCDIHVSASQLVGIEIPQDLIANAIDELPVLMVLAAFAEGKTVLKNAIELRYKESDRINSLIHNLRILGIECEEFEDGMNVDGLGSFPPPYHYKNIQLDSFSDHRIAMAFSLAALKMKQTIEINNCHNVNTSFPNFVRLMKSLGLNISKKSISEN